MNLSTDHWEDFLTMEEKQIFLTIYNDNFVKLQKNQIPTLLNNIQLPNVRNEDAYNGYKEISIIDDIHFKKGQQVYTDGFKKYINDLDKIIYDDSKQKEIKFILIGELLRNFHCNANFFKFRLVKHILNYVDKIIFNKALLLKRMDQLIVDSVKKIGNCDYENFEALSNKEIEEFFRNINPDSIPNSILYSFKYISVKMPNQAITNAYNYFNNYFNKHKQSPIEQNSKEQLNPIINQNDLEMIRNNASKARVDLISLNGLKEQKFCSFIELAKTYEKTNHSPYWLTIPRLSMMIMSSSSIITSAVLTTTGTTATTLTKEFTQHHFANALMLATFLTTTLSPLVGLIISLGIGTLLESKFWKDLRNSRLINLEFMKFISTQEGFAQMLNTENIDDSNIHCSFRLRKDEYINKFKEVNANISEYNEYTRKYFDDHIDKLYFYLFVYHLSCKIKPELRNLQKIDEYIDVPAPPKAILDPITELYNNYADELEEFYINSKERNSNEENKEKYQNFENKLKEIKENLGIEGCNKTFNRREMLEPLIHSLRYMKSNNIERRNDVIKYLCQHTFKEGGKRTKRNYKINKRRTLRK